jgi:predicted transcriptional regulator
VSTYGDIHSDIVSIQSTDGNNPTRIVKVNINSTVPKLDTKW